MTSIGGNAIEQTNPDVQQLVKGFRAQFWFSFASATVGALIALTLKIGMRGTHAEIRDAHIARKAQQEEEERIQQEERKPPATAQSDTTENI